MTLPLALSAEQHPIADHQISPGAHAACAGLREAGFKAYLVGGCVRDLLLGLQPKDFDVATDAEPEQLKQCFRRARIVGRRFKIVHLRFGREVIEVTTFRTHHAAQDDDLDNSNEAETCPDSGMLLRDNVYGSIEDDARRRDFTINSLFYDPIDGLIRDYTGGIQDLNERQLRVIGDPQTRFREDPVRMLRAVRFQAKLDFELDSATSTALVENRASCEGVSTARLFDEVLKLLMSGYGEVSFNLLERYGLFAVLFPQTANALSERPPYHQFLVDALSNTDLRIAQGKPVTPAFLFAALLWPAVAHRVQMLESTGAVARGDLLREAGADCLAAQLQHTAIPRRFSTPMREIWELHERLLRRRRPRKLFEHPRFRAAYDFVLLREQTGEDLEGAGEYWTQYQNNEAAPPKPKAQPRRRRRSRRGPRSTDASTG